MRTLESMNKPHAARGKPKEKPDQGRAERSLVIVSLSGGAILWAAMPPLAVGWLAWPAMVFWLLPVLWKKLPGRRPYRLLYAVGLLHWLLLIQWMRLPHWSAGIGWLFASAYLAAYLPLFVGLSRIAVHRWRCPLWIAAPVVWVGLEYARGHIVGGFSIFLLAHTQVDWPLVIQISDLGGAYAVSFVIVLVAACVALVMGGNIGQEIGSESPATSRRWRVPLVVAFSALVFTLGYGKYRIDTSPPSRQAPTIRVALIQGSIDTLFGPAGATSEEILLDYRRLTLEAVEENENLDLIIWPESMFAYRYYTWDERSLSPEGMTQEELDHLRKVRAGFEEVARSEVSESRGVPMLVGVPRYHLSGTQLETYNSALLLDASGKVTTCYDKMQPVWFGETLPLGEQLPWLYRLTPLPPGGLTPGKQPVVVEVGGLKLSPSICFESTVPQLIRKQVVQLTEQDDAPDVLVSMTNDGWFWGSACLDAHFNCCIFRAIENRCPMIIAANTGFSGSISGSGHVQEKGPRHAEEVVVATVSPDGRPSPYHVVGDLPAAACLILCFVLAGSSYWSKRR